MYAVLLAFSTLKLLEVSRGPGYCMSGCMLGGGTLEAVHEEIFWCWSPLSCARSDFHIGICESFLPLIHQHRLFCPRVPD